MWSRRYLSIIMNEIILSIVIVLLGFALEKQYINEKNFIGMESARKVV